MTMLWILLYAFTIGPAVVETASVLFVPVNLNSHILHFSQLAVAITKYGDQASILLPSNAKVPDQLEQNNVDVIIYQTIRPESFMNSAEMADLVLEAAFADSFLATFKVMNHIQTATVDHMYADCVSRFETNIINRIKSENFDFMIVDSTDFLCHAVLPYKLGIKYALYGVPMLMPHLYRTPSLPSFTKNIMAFKFEELTFWHRFANLLFELVPHAFLNSSTAFVEQYAPDKPIATQTELMRQASLWFTLDTYAFNMPSASMPNVISVADVMARPSTSSLSEDLQEFLDSATDGAVLVSPGSWMKKIPDEVLKKFCSAFKRVKLRIIWKIDDIGVCEVDETKIKIVKWMPQNDVLNHTNLKVFITHAGLNSVIESIYHATPMLAIPFSLDQPMNAATIVEKKLGLRLSISTFTEDELIDSIEQLLTDKEIQENVILASQLLRDLPDDAGRRASYWINHVLRYGDEHLRSSAFDLTTFQFLMGDLYLALYTCIILLVAISFLCLKCMCRCCVVKKRKEKEL